MLSSFLNVDMAIVISYLLLTLYIGIKSSKKIKTFKEYAIGDGTFTTPVLTATLLATLLGTENLMGVSEAVYSDGIIWILLFFGNSFIYMMTAIFIAPRIHKFNGCLSAAEIMSRINNNDSTTRLISAFTGLIMSVGAIGAQIVAIGYLSQEFLQIDATVGIVISAGIIVLYSTTGGIKAVAYTDMLQFIFLIVAVPIVSYFVFSKAGGVDAIANLSNKLEYQNHFSIISDKYSWGAVVSLVVLFYIPGLNPAIAQRLLMTANNTTKAVDSIRATAFTGLPFHFMVGLIGLSTLILYPNIQADLVFPTIIKDMLPIGIKGLAIAGILAIAMSTADSFLNIASVFITNDIIRVIKPNISDEKLINYTKVFTFFSGTAAIIAAISFKSIVTMILVFEGFWASMIEVPLLAGILGIHASSRTFIYASGTGAITTIIWMLFQLENILGFPSFGPALLLNSIVFFTMRYFERKDYISEKQLIKQNLPSIYTKVLAYKSFNVPDLLRSSISEHAQYVTFGVFVIATYIVPIFMWSQAGSTSDEYGVSIYLRVIAGILCSMLILSDKGKEKYAKYLPFYWLFSICYCLPFSTTFMFLENHGSDTWLVNLTISIFLLSTVTNWASFILLNIVGATAGYYFYSYIYGTNMIVLSNHQIYMTIYVTCFSSLIGFIFTRKKEYIQLKLRSVLQTEVNKQTVEIRDKNIQLTKYAIEVENYANTLKDRNVELEEKAILLKEKNYKLVEQRDMLEHSYIEIKKQKIEIERALGVKERFLNNISHEIRTPLHNLHSKTKLILNNWHAINEDRKKAELVIVNESNDELYKYVSNILDIAAYQAGDLTLNKNDKIDLDRCFTNVLTRLDKQIKQKDILIKKNLQDIVLYNIDEEKIEKAICYIIDNAVKYTKNEISIDSKIKKDQIQITISDNGIGILRGEEEKIFEAFEEGGNTKTKSSGKGLGLALSRSIIEKHDGKIWAQRNNQQGSKFTINLPLAVSKQKEKIFKTLENIIVIIVDDNINVLSSLELVMLSLGYRYKLFDNAIDALYYVKNNDIDVIITDYMMEPMNGIEFAQEIRKSNIDAPIILQSGIASENMYKDEMDNVRINIFIAKPYSKEMLEQAIYDAIQYNVKIKNIA